MKGLYIAHFAAEQLRQDTSDGIARKVYNQINNLKSHGFDMDYMQVKYDANRIMEFDKWLPIPIPHPHAEIIEKAASNDFLYVRKPIFLEGYRYNLMADAKKKNSKLKILMEIPTYPYDNETKGLTKRKDMLRRWKDMILRSELRGIVDRIITFSRDKEIWGIPTINISNAIDYEKKKRKHIASMFDGATIECIACAQLCFWHGYDRAIKGMADYYSKSNSANRKYDILLHVVGDGQDLHSYEELVKQNNLQDRVKLHGSMQGEALEEIYERCVIGLDSMGRHRSGVEYNSSLKGKEYLAKGLVIVSGVKTELDYDDNYKYYIRVPADDSNVDFNMIVVRFAEMLKSENLAQIQTNIMNYAKRNFDFPVAMCMVVDYLKRGE